MRRPRYLMNLVQTVVETLLFYHPAVLVGVSRVIRREREHACDDLAAAACGDRRRYAHAWRGWRNVRLCTAAGALAMGAAGASLLPRVRRLWTCRRPPSARAPDVGHAAAPVDRALPLLVGTLEARQARRVDTQSADRIAAGDLLFLRSPTGRARHRNPRARLGIRRRDDHIHARPDRRCGPHDGGG